MSLTKRKMLRRLESALKTMTVPDLNEGRLNEEQSDRFLREIEEASPALGEARQIGMTRDRVAIDRISMTQRVIVPGADASGNRRTFGANDRRKPTFQTNHLVAKEFGAVFPLGDDALERNLELDQLEDTLIELGGSAAGRDMEEVFYLGSKDIAYASDGVLNQLDGWLAKSPNRVYGQNSAAAGGPARDFDETVNTGRIEAQWPANMFSDLISAIDPKYLQNEADWRFHVSRTVLRQYHSLLANNGLINEILSPGPVTWENIPVVPIPVLGRAAAAGAYANAPGRVAALQMPDNMVYGIHRNIRIEPRREPLDRSTEFVLTFSGDCHYENEEASAVAFIDQAPDWTGYTA